MKGVDHSAKSGVVCFTMTLLIMAAGLGSRYGGLKQLDPITEEGEFIIDFSVYDAIKTGFDHVVIIVKKENYELFRDSIGKRIERFVDVKYVFQSLDALPEGFSLPDGRIKPWGTAHAVLSAAEVIDDDFAVINADDFYGRDAFAKIAEFFETCKRDAGKEHFCMVGYTLSHTLTENGYVSRGECRTDGDGNLISVTERTKICRREGRVEYTEDVETWIPIDENTVVSMNCWGFTKNIFPYIKDGFAHFLENLPEEKKEKGEYYLPSAVTEMMNAGACDVRVLKTNAKWYGVTYPEDKPKVVSEIKRMTDDGTYPRGLWKN